MINLNQIKKYLIVLQCNFMKIQENLAHISRDVKDQKGIILTLINNKEKLHSGNQCILFYPM